MRIVMRLLIVFSAISLLSGCGSWSSQYLTNVSNKNGGNVSAKENAASAPANQQCNQWCHNGWCSNHCENTVNPASK